MTETTPGVLSDRALIRLSGADVRDFLQGLVTQDVLGLTPEAPRWSGLLTPQGKAVADFLLWAEGEDVLIDAEATAAPDLMQRLKRYRLRRPIMIEAAHGAVWWSREGERGAPDPRLPALGRRWLGDPGSAAQGWRAHRLALGVTEGAAELGVDQTLWLECNAAELNGVSFTKGCYVGQENTARMHYRAKVNRRLMVAPLAPPAEERHHRMSYPDLGLMVELRRADAPGDAIVPEWLADALAPA